MKQKTLTFALVLSLAVNASVLATVGYHYYRNTCLTASAPCPLHRGGHLYEDLGLSSEQTVRMAALAKSFHRRLGELESEVDVKRNLLIDLLGEDRLDQRRATEIQKEIVGLQDDLQKEVIRHIAESKKIMNPGQQKRFIELLRTSTNNGRGNSPFPNN